MISTARGFKYDLRSTNDVIFEGSKLGFRKDASFQLSHFILLIYLFYLRFLTSNFSFLTLDF